MTTYPNWFAHYAQGFFEKHLAHLAGREGVAALQIGAFTGDASLWLLQNVLTGRRAHLVDVDTWSGSDEPEHESFNWADVERAYDEKTATYLGSWLVKYKGPSDRFFAACMSDYYDFVYVDGDHTAPGVLSDALNAFRALKPGGILAFDDYLWKPSSGGGETKAPGIAIDAFLDCYRDRVQVLAMGLQVWVRKIA